MKQSRIVSLLLAVFVALAFIVSCDNSTEPEKSSYEVLTNYLVDNNMDLPDILDGWTISASNINGSEDSYYIIDIRAESAYNDGHIDGAVNSTLGNILDAAAQNNENKPIVVVCYSGQSAAHGVVALRLSGYSDAKSMVFGMSAWNTDFAAPWNGNVGDEADNYQDNWTTDAPASVQEYDPPDWNSNENNGADILAERVDAMLSGGFQGISNTDVLSAPDNYFVNNFWAETDWNTYGHIAGAYRIFEDLSLEDGGIENLDPSEEIVTYCWTGQTSSMVTAYLTVLGFDASSLTFGANGMIHSDLAAHKWTTSTPGEYSYVTE